MLVVVVCVGGIGLPSESVAHGLPCLSHGCGLGTRLPFASVVQFSAILFPFASYHVVSVVVRVVVPGFRPHPTVLVTHAVSIAALTRVSVMVRDMRMVFTRRWRGRRSG